jgi:hypothetical protein
MNAYLVLEQTQFWDGDEAVPVGERPRRLHRDPGMATVDARARTHALLRGHPLWEFLPGGDPDRLGFTTQQAIMNLLGAQPTHRFEEVYGTLEIPEYASDAHLDQLTASLRLERFRVVSAEVDEAWFETQSRYLETHDDERDDEDWDAQHWRTLASILERFGLIDEANALLWQNDAQ